MWLSKLKIFLVTPRMCAVISNSSFRLIVLKARLLHSELFIEYKAERVL